MDDKIVAFPGAKIEDPSWGEASEPIVAALERVLDDARAGRVQSLAFAYEIDKGDGPYWRTFRHWRNGGFWPLRNGVSLLEAQFEDDIADVARSMEDAV